MQTSKKYFKQLGMMICLLLAVLFIDQKAFGQTAIITFDYTGGTNNCSGEADNTYSGTSGASVIVPTTGIPPGATITGISFTARYGVFIGTVNNFNFILNGTSIGIFSASNNTCVTGNVPVVSIPLFNKTGPNTLQVTFSGGFIPGVYNGILTVTYSVCPAITATATKNDISCFNANTGVITVNVPGTGTAPFQYSIDNGVHYFSASGSLGYIPGASFDAALHQFKDLPVGSYQVRIKDDNGCESKQVQ